MSDADFQKAYDGETLLVPLHSGKMSELCKYAWAGSMAIMFTLLTAEDKTRAAQFLDKNFYCMVGAAVCGSAAFVLDYMQNYAAYRHSRKVVEWIEVQKSPPTQEEYNRKTQSGWLSASKGLFFFKNCFAIFSAVLLALAVLRSLSH